jgi:hypothetical protein
MTTIDENLTSISASTGHAFDEFHMSKDSSCYTTVLNEKIRFTMRTDARHRVDSRGTTSQEVHVLYEQEKPTVWQSPGVRTWNARIPAHSFV